jgi:replicative DNA helicase
MRSSNTEIHILGTLISEGTQMVDVVDILTPDMFESVATSSIYAAMQKMFDENKGIDLVTLSERVAGNKAVEAKGGTAWLASMAANYTPGLLREYALLLKERYVQKKALGYAREVQRAVIDGLGVDEIVSIVNKGADAVNNLLIVAGATRSIKSIIPEVLEQLEARMLVAQKGGITGIPTGLAKLDKVTNGWRGNQLIVLAARPGQGKTQLAIHFAITAALRGRSSLFFTLEMSAVSLVERALVNTSGVDSDTYRNGRLSPDQWQQVTTAGSSPGWTGILIDDTPLQTVRKIRTDCLLLKRTQRLDMVIIDYLQLVEPDDRHQIREQQVATMTRALKLLAKELGVPVILLCQLNREAENNPGKRPSLANLRESGAIEQDADLVLLLMRPEVYGIKTIDIGEQIGVSTAGLGFLDIAKQRDGATGTILFRTNKQFSEIKDY